MRKLALTPDERLKHKRLSAKKYWDKPEIKERQKVYRQEYYLRPTVQKHREEYYSRPEIIEALKIYREKYYARPDIKNKRRIYQQEYFKNKKAEQRRKLYQKYYRMIPEKQTRKHELTIKRKYGLSEIEYNQMFQDQHGLCAICKKTNDKKLSIDHCHKRGILRGLLCNNCNAAIAFFNDSIEILFSAIKYLQKYNEQ
jgi:hypothetical protein